MNALGIELLKKFEKCELKAYRDKANVLTIGWGHTGKVVDGMVITQEQADALLVKDVAISEWWAKRLVKVPLNENQLSALVSFTYNVGPSRLEYSTLLIKLNEGDYESAAAQFRRWYFIHIENEVIEDEGLLERRLAERDLFMTPPCSSTEEQPSLASAL